VHREQPEEDEPGSDGYKLAELNGRGSLREAKKENKEEEMVIAYSKQTR